MIDRPDHECGRRDRAQDELGISRSRPVWQVGAVDVLGELPPSFFDVTYEGSMIPGRQPQLGLTGGANCQRFAYEVLRHFGRRVPDLRSSDLWADVDATVIPDEPGPLDLVLFGVGDDAWGAHVGVYLGGEEVLHLCKEVGVPAVWDFAQFARQDRYRPRVGFKRVRPEVRFRSLQRSDFPMLAEWFSELSVLRWWNEDLSSAGIEAKYGPRVDGRDATTMWIAEIDGAPAGLFQHYRHVDYPDHDEAVGIDHAVGIDFLLSEAFSGRGLGAEVLSRFADLVLELTPDALWCVATPAQENRRSWRALKKAHFRRRGTCQPPGEPPAFAYARQRSEQGGQVKEV